MKAFGGALHALVVGGGFWCTPEPLGKVLWLGLGAAVLLPAGKGSEHKSHVVFIGKFERGWSSSKKTPWCQSLRAQRWVAWTPQGTKWHTLAFLLPVAITR